VTSAGTITAGLYCGTVAGDRASPGSSRARSPLIPLLGEDGAELHPRTEPPMVRLAEVTGARQIVQFGAETGFYFDDRDFFDLNRVKSPFA
jgi:hypothetical protein